MGAAALRYVDVAARAGLSVDAVRRLAASDKLAHGTRLGSALRVAVALGAAPAELWPMLAMRPRRGLLWERGVFTSKGRR